MIKSISVALMFLGSLGAFAQHDHGNHGKGGTHLPAENKPPHSGQLLQAGKYQIEMVADLFLKEDQLTFYIFKQNMKAMTNEYIIGNITMHHNDGTTVSTSLQGKGEDCFVAQLESKESFHCIAEFYIKDEMVRTEFFQEGLAP